MSHPPNEVIALMLRHRSIRRYRPDPVPEEDVRWIIQSAQAASTSSFLQAYTIIGVRNAELRAELAALSNNAHVAEAPLFLVFLADLRRLSAAAARHGVAARVETTEAFIVATVDAALAAQNAAVAAESLGYGICYIGGLRNAIDAVSERLGLPEQVTPLFGMTVGRPAEDPAPKPRLPLTVVYHEERYDIGRDAGLSAYDEVVRAYYRARTGGRREDTYTGLVARTLAEPRRAHMAAYLRARGFLRDQATVKEPTAGR
ncbi:oxygen-insensitive NADPH nitroreductase [Hydrogenibacillus sp. N12]|uniref:oxygen-insensitive NADPH nitroreductase n=1 Tax=Hydrogenibacillus sp. N12 TaxID=2866627 RepID=UPI001C7DDF26|nr:oxygen-insensitive NADPH nitroreductase [Hydrogenibacillus sp. N12]QZA33325.1 oxygen-insensitive NADPH nitroreductase [Hydrogenibacillus sp. N12]